MSYSHRLIEGYGALEIHLLLCRPLAATLVGKGLNAHASGRPGLWLAGLSKPYKEPESRGAPHMRWLGRKYGGLLASKAHNCNYVDIYIYIYFFFYHVHVTATAVLKTRRQNIYCRCPLLQTARTNVWPIAVQLHTELYGSKEELEKTATFILQTEL